MTLHKDEEGSSYGSGSKLQKPCFSHIQEKTGTELVMTEIRAAALNTGQGPSTALLLSSVQNIWSPISQ